MPDNERKQTIREDRQHIYGDPAFSNHNLGLMWTGILQDHFQVHFPNGIPSYVVATMLACLKIGRSVRPFNKPDNDDYVDMENYMDFAEEINPYCPGRNAVDRNEHNLKFPTLRPKNL